MANMEPVRVFSKVLMHFFIKRPEFSRHTTIFYPLFSDAQLQQCVYQLYFDQQSTFKTWVVFFMKNAGLQESSCTLRPNKVTSFGWYDNFSQTFPSCGLWSFFHFNKTKLKLVSSKPNYGCDDGNEQSSVNFFCQKFLENVVDDRDTQEEEMKVLNEHPSRKSKWIRYRIKDSQFASVILIATTSSSTTLTSSFSATIKVNLIKRHWGMPKVRIPKIVATISWMVT